MRLRTIFSLDPPGVPLLACLAPHPSRESPKIDPFDFLTFLANSSYPPTPGNSLFAKSEFTFGVRFGVKLAKIVVPPLAGKFTFSLSLSGSSGPRRGIQGGWTQAGRLAKPMQRNTTPTQSKHKADATQTQRGIEQHPKFQGIFRPFKSRNADATQTQRRR